MYLKLLEMYGFKSFSEKTVLEFMPGVTTVIGPNGSGKSNISDCIRWILGEQSIKTLRGSKAEDIIFSGTQNRKSIAFAEGSLIFDNSDGKLPIEYNEVVITRKLYRSGETGYFINKAPCRLKDIVELFMDTGVGRDGYSIIGQGKIDQILSNKSEDRRNIFEEAAGIVKYRVRKEESEKKLEQTKVNLLRINDIVSEIELNIEPLKQASEKARKFLDLREQLKSIEVGLFLYNIDDYKSKIEDIKNNIEVFETQKVKEETKQVELQEAKETIKKDIDFLLEQIEKTQNLGFESEKKKEQYQSEISVSEERIKNNNDNDTRYEKDIQDLLDKNKELSDEKQNKIDKKTNLKTNKEKFVKELEEKQAELDKYAKTLSSKQLEIEEHKKKVDLNIDEKFELSNNISTEKANYENLEKQEKQLDNDIQDTISNLDKARDQKQELNSSFYSIEKQNKELSDKLEKINNEKQKSNEKIESYESKINELNQEYRDKDTRHRFLLETEKEKEGYNFSVKKLLEGMDKNASLKKGVCGVLADLIQVEDKYQTAIEMALGGSIQNIVTETEEEAKALVEYLRENKLGRSTFLPISSVKGTKLSTLNQSGVKGVIGIASDLVKVEKKYEDIILNLLGRTVIVDNIDNAVQLAKKNKYGFKIVSQDGDVISSGGSISGGSVNKKTVSLLGRTAEIKSLAKDLKSIEEKIKKLQKELDDYKQSISQMLSNYDELQGKMQEIQIVYATEKQKIDLAEQEILKEQTKLEKLKEDKKNLQKEKEENLKKQKEYQEKITSLDEESSSLAKIIEEFTESNKDDQKYIDDLNFDITNLKISVSSFDESETSIDEFVARINTDIENNLKSIENKKELRTKIKTINEELTKKIEETKQAIVNLLKEVSNSSETVDKLKQDRTIKNEKLSKIEEELDTQNKTIEDVRNQISKLDLKSSKLDLELNQVINKMWEEYELTPNNTGDIKKIEKPQEVTKQVNSLREEIRELGSVNVDSIKEYQDLKQRYDFMCEQRLDLENASSKLKQVIQEMTQTMQEQFITQFKTINKNFGEVFKELFGGGKAELILEDENNVLECGIEIQVQPPGKKLQNMLLLSGGEKAFTAIALLFAILKINPAPFCVLDEIEAALDDVNVYRFADYLKQYTENTQFLVITHRKGTMEAADTVYGITMEEKGVSKLLSMKMK